VAGVSGVMGRRCPNVRGTQRHCCARCPYIIELYLSITRMMATSDEGIGQFARAGILNLNRSQHPMDVALGSTAFSHQRGIHAPHFSIWTGVDSTFAGRDTGVCATDISFENNFVTNYNGEHVDAAVGTDTGSGSGSILIATDILILHP
jgi:hypothetical protein